MNHENNIQLLRNLGLLLIMASLLFAWVLTWYRYLKKVDEKVVNTEYILKAHIDYVLMGILLILFSVIDTGSPDSLIWITCIGAISNPGLFVVMAFKPNINKASTSIFGIITTLSFIATTVGFGGLCLYNYVL